MRLFTISILVFLSSAIFAQNFEWTAQNSGVTVKLNDVYFTNNQTGWAVGDDGTIVNTTNGGQTWSTQTSGTTEQLRSVFFIDANTGWAVGGSINKTMLKTTDGGVAWQDASANSIPNKLMFDIEFFNTNTGWVVSYDSIYMTTDGGSTWVSENYYASSEQNPRVLAVTSDTTAYVGGSKFASATTREAVVFYRNTVDTPLAWHISPFNNSTTDDEFTSIDFTASKIGFAGGQKGKLYKKSGPQDMDAWNMNLDLSSTGANFIWSISFPNDNNGMFNTSVEISGTTYALIYHTTNTGDTWSAIPDSIQDFLSPTLYAPDTANAWIVGVGGKIYKGEMITTGIRGMELDFNINIYPNPTTNIINVEINSEKHEILTYNLLDISGRLIKNGKWNLNSSGSRFTLDLSDISKGTYFLKLNTEEGQTVRRISKN